MVKDPIEQAYGVIQEETYEVNKKKRMLTEPNEKTNEKPKGLIIKRN